MGFFEKGDRLYHNLVLKEKLWLFAIAFISGMFLMFLMEKSYMIFWIFVVVFTFIITMGMVEATRMVGFSDATYVIKYILNLSVCVVGIVVITGKLMCSYGIRYAIVFFVILLAIAFRNMSYYGSDKNILWWKKVVAYGIQVLACVVEIVVLILVWVFIYYPRG